MPSAAQAAQLDRLRDQGHGNLLRMQSWFRRQCQESASASGTDTSVVDGGAGGGGVGVEELGSEELREAVERLGLRVNQKLIRDMIEAMDTYGDGAVDMEEFLEKCPPEVTEGGKERHAAQ